MRLTGIVCGIGLLLLSANIATAMQKHAPNPSVDRAEQLVHAGKYQEAYDLLNPLEQSLSGDSRFNYLLGRAALGIGQADKARTLFEHSIKLRPPRLLILPRTPSARLLSPSVRLT